MTIEELKKYKRVLIIGYGREGKAVQAFLKVHHPTAAIGIADKKEGDDYLNRQTEFDLAIRSPGISPELVTIPYTTVTNIFFANCPATIIGVTGTKGKSTTSTLIYEILKADGKEVYLGGNIGRPALEFLDKLSPQSIIVLELSSFQLQDIRYSPHIAVLLMITPEHLDYHKNMGVYVDAKRNILRFQSSHDFAILNRDYLASNESDIYTDGKVYFISRERSVEQGCFIREGKIILRRNAEAETKAVKEGNYSLQEKREAIQEEKIINTKEILLRGKHNLENVCAAVMAASIAGCRSASMIRVLRSFTGLEHRLEFVGERYGVLYYNDSLATIPEATIEALEAFDGKVHTLIAGGYDRGLDFAALGAYLAKSSVQTLILFSPSGERIWEAIVTADKMTDIKHYIVSTMHEAVVFASEETEAGFICLLSPASASFGAFKDYADRGDQFRKEVTWLKVG